MRARVVTDADVALLRALSRDRTVVAASRAVGMSRDRATYRIARLNEAFGGPVVASDRGGRSHGASRLTELGDEIVRRGFDSVELLDNRSIVPPSRSNRFSGTYHRGSPPLVTLAGGVTLRVAFGADDGEAVTVLLDPESILIAPGQFPSSARNVLRATIERVERRGGELASTLVARAGPLRMHVAVTEETLRQLRLRAGRPVFLYVKATALRRVGRASARPIRGSLRR